MNTPASPLPEQADVQAPWNKLADVVGSLELGDDALLCLSDDRTIALSNPGAQRLFGLEPANIQACPFMSLVSQRRPGVLDEGFEDVLKAPLAQVHRFPQGALKARRSPGDDIPLEGSLSLLRIGASHGFTLVLRDATDRLLTEERLRHLATHDSLTGLPNRLILQDRLESAIQRHSRDRDLFALLFIDLDAFKEINDRLGHEAGDTVLRACAQRLISASRRSDTVSRIGGDEFVVLIEPLQTRQHLAAALRRLSERLHASPIRFESQLINLHASIGVSLFPTDARSATGLMRHADSAMYADKHHIIRSSTRDRT